MTGEMSEGATIVKIILDDAMDRPDEEIDAALKRWIDYSVDVGMTRWITEKTKDADIYEKFDTPFPPAGEKMNIEEMILGYTINGGKQLGIEAAKGSITAGKDADFLVFDKDLLTAEKEGFSHNKPSEVYFSGKKMN